MEKNGKVKEYHYNGILIMEREFLNDEKDGKVIEYNAADGKLLFEGEYVNGKRNG